MPAIKAISGHTNCQKAKRYLEKNGRALARDFFNLSWDEREMAGYDEELKEHVEWADEMDALRRQCGNDTPHEGRRARTYKHFVISPDPDDHIDLPALRELASAWAVRFFDDYQVAIVYHDDNEGRIPHAHLIVNCTNLVTGNRLHTDDPLALNRALQDMARNRGLAAFSNLKAKEDGKQAQTNARVRLGKAEKRLLDANEYSWVSDIRSRVGVARSLARNEGEFKEILGMLGVQMADNSPKARTADWVFALADAPARRVTGAKLGALYSKESLRNGFSNMAAVHPDGASSRAILKAARNAVVVEDVADLHRLSAALDTCSRHGVRSITECDARIRSLEARMDSKGSTPKAREALAELKEARNYVSQRGLLPDKAPKKPKSANAEPEGKAASKRRTNDTRAKRVQSIQRDERRHER